MHTEQIEFCQQILIKYPYHFQNVKVLDVGSQDINGNNRYLFTNCNYLGLDIGPGKNVDIVAPVHEYYNNQWLRYKGPNNEYITQYNTIISTEMLEHDKYWLQSIQAMYKLLAPGGLLLITAAGKNRAEHGTARTTPEASPHTTDYYKNITIPMLQKALKPYWQQVVICTEFNQGKDIGLVLIKE